MPTTRQGQPLTAAVQHLDQNITEVSGHHLGITCCRGPRLDGSAPGRHQVGQREHPGTEHAGPGAAFGHRLDHAHHSHDTPHPPRQVAQRHPRERAPDPTKDPDDQPPRHLHHRDRYLSSTRTRDAVVGTRVHDQSSYLLRAHPVAL